ncbi:MAG TPA: FtsX-like permease family protein, partial [Longimicrobiales bacterium]|nr:FtsX-like permease family protein [Longimicrobiales bacterium]
AVLPEGFGFPFKQNAWVITGPDFDGVVELVGRLAPGAAADGAAAELGARWRSGDAARSPERTGGRVQVEPYTGGRGEGGEKVAFVGLVMVGLCLLLIACANVANLLLVRATERARALGVQAALGASRSQIGAQLLLEALLLAVGGGLAGLVLASTAIDATQKALSAEHFGYFWMRLGVDGPLLLAVGGLVLATALVAGVLPIFRVGRMDLHQVLKEDGAAGAAMGGGGAWSRGFVTVQLALSCGALVVAGLTGQSLADSRGFGSGVPAREVLLATVDPRAPGGDAVPVGRLQALQEGLSALPGVTSAALALGAPGYRERYSRLELEGAGDVGSAPRFVQWNAVGVTFFA